LTGLVVVVSFFISTSFIIGYGKALTGFSTSAGFVDASGTLDLLLLLLLLLDLL